MKTVLLTTVKLMLLGILVTGWIVTKELGVPSLIRALVLFGLGGLVLSINSKNKSIYKTSFSNSGTYRLTESKTGIDFKISSVIDRLLNPLTLSIIYALGTILSYPRSIYKHQDEYTSSTFEIMILGSMVSLVTYLVITKSRLKQIVINILIVLVIFWCIYEFDQPGNNGYDKYL